MRISSRAVQFFCFLLLLLFAAGPASAVSSKDSLKGLKGIEIVVDEVGADLEEYNVTTSQVLVDVVARLKKAGIEVVSREEGEKIQPLRRPYLAVKITSYKLKQGFALGMVLGLNQQVIVRGSPELKKVPFFAPTWYTTFVGAVSVSRVAEVYDVLNILLDKFSAAYLEVNPRP